MTVGSLFSGIGGWDLGLERAGMRVVWHAETDPLAAAVLAQHWPHVPNLGDVTLIAWEDVPRVDVLVGSPPCQPFSSAANKYKRGTADDRHLWPAMARGVATLRPRWVLVENVTQFDGVALEQVVADLEAMSYQVAPPLEIPACAVGCDHGRARLWLCGYTDRHSEPGHTVDAEVARLSRGRGDARGVGAAHGLPARLDRARLRALGNAVVPQVAEVIGRAVMAADTHADDPEVRRLREEVQGV